MNFDTRRRAGHRRPGTPGVAVRAQDRVPRRGHRPWPGHRLRRARARRACLLSKFIQLEIRFTEVGAEPRRRVARAGRPLPTQSGRLCSCHIGSNTRRPPRSWIVSRAPGASQIDFPWPIRASLHWRIKFWYPKQITTESEWEVGRFTYGSKADTFFSATTCSAEPDCPG